MGDLAADVVPLELTVDEAVAVGEVAAEFAAALPADRGAEFRALADAADRGAIPSDLVEPLQRVCALALQTGRARAVGSAEIEGLVAAVYRRTPAGRELAESSAAVNRALGHLTGRTLRSARVSAGLPGHYQLQLQVDGVGVVIATAPAGLTVTSLQAG
jgi:hypothetical protein